MLLEDVTKRRPVLPFCSLWEHYHYLERNYCMGKQFDLADTLTQYSLHSRKFPYNTTIKKSGITYPKYKQQWTVTAFAPSIKWMNCCALRWEHCIAESWGTSFRWNNPSPRWKKQNQPLLTAGLGSSIAFLLCTRPTAAQLLHPGYALPGWSAQIPETTRVSCTSNQLHPEEHTPSILEADRSG